MLNGSGISGSRISSQSGISGKLGFGGAPPPPPPPPANLISYDFSQSNPTDAITEKFYGLDTITTSRASPVNAVQTDESIDIYGNNAVALVQNRGALLQRDAENLFINSGLSGSGLSPDGWGGGGIGTSESVTSTLNSSLTAWHQVALNERPYISQSITIEDTKVYTVSYFIESVTGSGTARSISLIALQPGSATTVTYPICTANPTGGEAGTVQSGRLDIKITAGATESVTCRIGAGTTTDQSLELVFSLPQFVEYDFTSSPVVTPVDSTGLRVEDFASIPTTYGAGDDTLPSNNISFKTEVYPLALSANPSTVFNISSSSTNDIKLSIYDDKAQIIIKSSAGQDDTLTCSFTPVRDELLTIIFTTSSVDGLKLEVVGENTAVNTLITDGIFWNNLPNSMQLGINWQATAAENVIIKSFLIERV